MHQNFIAFNFQLVCRIPGRQKKNDRIELIIFLIQAQKVPFLILIQEIIDFEI
jgi:hypothetical protein